MNTIAPLPVMVSVIPEHAPFSPEQRAWLNGFFAAYLQPGQGLAGAVAMPLSAPAEEDDGTPWHDPSMPIDERMRLAEGKPLRHRMMAAMAQQDCGQCGYNCQDYSDAIVSGAEARLNLCVPGEKATLRMLKTLAAEMDGAPVPAPSAPAAAAVAAPKKAVTEDKPGYSRKNPVEVTFYTRRRLNKEDSEKSTYHIEFDLAGSGIEYTVGDSFGVVPKNDSALVDAVLQSIGAPAQFPIYERSLRDVLLDEVSLGSAPDALFELISYMTGGERRQKARCLAKGEDPDGDAHTFDVLAALEKFRGIRPDPEAFVEVLEPLQPRLYSISSSPKATPGRVSLTVDHVRYLMGERIRRGVASSWLSERLQSGAKIMAYVQTAHNFALPDNNDTPIIMIGPGTGVAPFRAFLHERHARRAKGQAWLFFGHQRRAADYFYEDEIEDFLANGVLKHVSLAWSRDQGKKVYVQDKMREEGPELWAWLERGSHFYVCGDAKRMASDVEKALTEIVARHGGLDEGAAKAFIQDLKKSGRYQTDVY